MHIEYTLLVYVTRLPIVTSVSVATICRVFSSAFTTKLSKTYQYYSIKRPACQRQKQSFARISNISYEFVIIRRELTLGVATLADPHRPTHCRLREHASPASASLCDRASPGSPDDRRRCSAPWASPSTARLPRDTSLLSSVCSSGLSFAIPTRVAGTFLQIPPHDGHTWFSQRFLP